MLTCSYPSDRHAWCIPPPFSFLLQLSLYNSLSHLALLIEGWSCLQFAAKAEAVGAAVPDVIVRPGKGHGWPEMPDEDWPHLVEWFDEHLLNK